MTAPAAEERAVERARLAAHREEGTGRQGAEALLAEAGAEELLAGAEELVAEVGVEALVLGAEVLLAEAGAEALLARVGVEALLAGVRGGVGQQVRAAVAWM